MEIELDLKNANVSWLAIGAMILVIVALGIVGYQVTENGRLLTWDDWQIRKIRRVYQAEVQVLQTAVASLAVEVNRDEVDPLRAQIVAERVARTLERSVTLSALSAPRQVVENAALSVRNWALGGARENATQALDQAIQAVEQARSRLP